MKPILIYGGGGFAREVAWLIESCNEAALDYEIVGFIDDNKENQGNILNDICVMSLEAAHSQFPKSSFVVAVGTPRTRQLLTEKALSMGFVLETILHPRVERSQRIQIGSGTVICAGNILTTNIVLGQNVQINLDCTIGHDVIMGNYTTLAPGVHVSGWVHFGERAYVGTGAVIINGTEEHPLYIGNDAVIGAGSCVTKNVPAGLTVVGIPAKPLQR